MKRILQRAVFLALCLALAMVGLGASYMAETTETAAISTTLRIYPAGGSPAFVLVNLGETSLEISKTYRLEQESDGGWTDLDSGQSGLVGSDQVPPNGILFRSFSDLLDTGAAGHYRLTLEDLGGETWSCEFWITGDWDWGALNYEEILSPSPFAGVKDPEEVVLTVDPAYTVTASESLAFAYAIENRADQTLRAGQEHYMEILLDGTWYLTPTAGWDAVAYYVASGETLELPAYLVGEWGGMPPFDEPFPWPAGTYRLVVPVTEVSDSGEETKVLLAETFSLES